MGICTVEPLFYGHSVRERFILRIFRFVNFLLYEYTVFPIYMR